MIANRKGSGLIELMVALTILSVAMLAITSSYIYSSKSTLKNNLKTNASNIAAKQLERIKSLDYNDVGLKDGYDPAGLIDYHDTEVLGGISYSLITEINWVDDNADGLFPADTDSRDYKRVKITVSIPAYPSVKPQVFSIDITRQSNEAVASGGNLEVTVVDPDNNPIDQVEAQITAGPPSLENLPKKQRTDENGKATFRTLPASVENGDYLVTAVKEGYVLDPSTPNGNTTVKVGDTSQLTFTMAQAGNLQITLVDDSTGQDITSQSKLTLNFPNADPIEHANSTGYFNIEGLFPGVYEINAANDDYELLTRPNIEIESGHTTNLTFRMTPKTAGNLNLTVRDATTGMVISNANVLISGLDFPQDIEDMTNTQGILEKQLFAQNYRLQVSKADYETDIRNFSVTGGNTTNISVSLNHNAPAGATIRILIYNRRNGAPRADVSTRIIGPVTQSKQTNSSGEALYDNLNPGTYRVQRYDGRWRDIGNVTLSNGDERLFTVRY